MATSLVHQHLKQREMGHLTLSHPGGIPATQRGLMHCFVSFPGGFESGRCKLVQAGEASSVRLVPAHIDQHYKTNITDSHQHYRVSRQGIRI
ncbi:MAG: hypothetical protein JWO52_2135 [Gammaproteobacteria bacterium]|nr:hypothetical protein [Gammaproteobacteria bacterium]